MGKDIKTIILAGGLGTRISEETADKPKPMVLLDDKPIIWHVMSIYAAQTFTDFVIAGGYKIEVIEEWVRNLKTDWNIEVIDTGSDDQTGSRILKSMNHIGSERVFATYGDGLGNINLKSLLEAHDEKSLPATITAVRPPARFGVLESEDGIVTHFGEKNQADAGWINGGFFVLEPDLLDTDFNANTSFEMDVIPRLVSLAQVSVHHHEGFWQPMDTLRERNVLAELTKSNKPPWLRIA